MLQGAKAFFVPGDAVCIAVQGVLPAIQAASQRLCTFCFTELDRLHPMCSHCPMEPQACLSPADPDVPACWRGRDAYAAAMHLLLRSAGSLAADLPLLAASCRACLAAAGAAQPCLGCSRCCLAAALLRLPCLAAGAVAQMMGMKVGDTREVLVTLPQQWEPPQFAGVEVTLTMTIKELFDRELPEVGHASTCLLPTGQPVHHCGTCWLSRPQGRLLGRGTGLRQCPQPQRVPPGCCSAAQPKLVWQGAMRTLAPWLQQLSPSLPGPGDGLGPPLQTAFSYLRPSSHGCSPCLPAVKSAPLQRAHSCCLCAATRCHNCSATPDVHTGTGHGPTHACQQCNDRCLGR